jgi:phage terminase large subunit-like protein
MHQIKGIQDDAVGIILSFPAGKHDDQVDALGLVGSNGAGT